MSNSGSLTPNDLRNQEFERKVRGYDPVEVAAILEEAAAQWERILAENLHLSEKCTTLEEQIKKYADLEQTLRDTLVLARKAAEDEKETAKKEAKLLIDRARHEAEGIVRQADSRAEQYRRQTEQLRQTRNRLKADLRALLLSYTEQIRQLGDADAPAEEMPPPARPPAGMPESAERTSTPDFPGSATIPVTDDTYGSTASPEIGDEQEPGDTPDAFDAALNKIFGAESDETTSDKSDTKGGPSSGSGS